ncbi:hypothetical protein PCANC_12759 [Puccinia coronata f. sp. avenae]|uniref:Uncharacterized protein n=1 Tax=Puccinia coronata f. sp. avenae TaxID=200324 RepID=A0A2N5SCR2_9BASI|nr:hypothetical protein PCANC_24207 [Puccinia coronata f. sp. avenae]PLW50245.1 hypothetical protein PCANC_12759 [Puccinia coronata f. sp. avenae]
MLENTAGDVKQTGISQFFRVQPLFVNSSLPAMLAQMVASKFTSDAAIQFKLRRRATE